MKTVSIKSKHILKIINSDEKTDIYGSNQDWYHREKQRRCGCGPATVTNIIYYIRSKHLENNQDSRLTKEKCLELMNEMWSFVTPGPRGIPSTAMLGEGIVKYLHEHKLDIRLDYLGIPGEKQLRPDLGTVVAFLQKPLENDIPVAFLNLDNGKVDKLESYHWVTVTSMEYSLEENMAYLEIIDGGDEIKIDLLCWLNTTKAGGGFVSFTL